MTRKFILGDFMREVLNRTLLVGDLVYLCSSDIMAIVIGSKKFYTEKGIRQAYPDERVVKVDVIDEEAVTIKNKLDISYKKGMEDKLYVKNKVQQPGDVFSLKNMGTEHCIIYLGISKKIYEKIHNSNNEYMILYDKKVYLKVRLFAKARLWINDMLEKKEFYVDDTIINYAELLYSVRGLTSFDEYVTNIKLNNLSESIKIYRRNSHTIVYF